MVNFTVLNIGQLSRNRFWGESETQAYRMGVCTSTLILSEGRRLIVDPGLTPAEMSQALDGRSGLKPDDIDTVYITHHHADHYVGLACFTNAEVYVPSGELEAIGSAFSSNTVLSAFADRLHPVPEELLPEVRPFPLPGHCDNLAGLLFESFGQKIAVAGDGVMTKDFFREETGYFNSVDMEACRTSIRLIKGMADIVIPGHDNYFIIDL